MQGLKRLQSAIERHRENKDINIKYKTPLTSEYTPSLLSVSKSASASLIFDTISLANQS
jgi:hypothetical protein